MTKTPTHERRSTVNQNILPYSSQKQVARIYRATPQGSENGNTIMVTRLAVETIGVVDGANQSSEDWDQSLGGQARWFEYAWVRWGMLIVSTGSKIDIRRCLRSTKYNAAIIYESYSAVANMTVDKENQTSGAREESVDGQTWLFKLEKL